MTDFDLCLSKPTNIEDIHSSYIKRILNRIRQKLKELKELQDFKDLKYLTLLYNYNRIIIYVNDRFTDDISSKIKDMLSNNIHELKLEADPCTLTLHDIYLNRKHDNEILEINLTNFAIKIKF